MNTKVNLAGVELKNPVMVASGTFGSGAEYSEFVDLNRLGAVVTKGCSQCTMAGQSGTAYCGDSHGHAQCHRTQNPGIDHFFKERSAVFGEI